MLLLLLFFLFFCYYYYMGLMHRGFSCVIMILCHCIYSMYSLEIKFILFVDFLRSLAFLVLL